MRRIKKQILKCSYKIWRRLSHLFSEIKVVAMYQGVEKNFGMIFVYIAKKIASYFLVLLILIELLVHYCSLILLWDKKSTCGCRIIGCLYNTFNLFNRFIFEFYKIKVIFRIVFVFYSLYQ